MKESFLYFVSKHRLQGYVWPLLATLLSVWVVNGYKYGISDQTITVPFVKSYLDPQLYPGDELVAQKQYFLTFFWEAVSYIVYSDFSNIEEVFFTLYLITLFLFFFYVYKLSMLFFNSEPVAVLALFLLLFRFETIGHVNSIEILMYTRQVTAFMLLAGMYHFFRQNFFTGFLWLAIAFLIHPLSAIYAWAIVGVAYLFTSGRENWKKRLMPLIVPFLLMGLLFVKKLLNPLPEPVPFFADEEWLRLLKIRSAHHIFPSLWPVEGFIWLFLAVCSYYLSLHFIKDAFIKRVLQWFLPGFLTMFLLGWFFVEVVPVSLVIQLQLFRSSKLLFWLAIILFSGTLANYLKTGQYGSALLLSLISYGLIGHYYGPTFNSVFWVITIGLVAVLLGKEKTRRFFFENYRTVGVFVTVAILTVNFLALSPFTISNRQDKKWLDVQYWAKNHTRVNSVFITPPEKEGFRIASERRIYADWKEGTQMFFNPAFGTGWMNKMMDLGFDPETKEFKYPPADSGLKKIVSQLNDNEVSGIYLVSEKKIKTHKPIHREGKYFIYLLK